MLDSGIQRQEMDGPLGRWTLTGSNAAELPSLVDSIWLFEGVTAQPVERVFPTGMLEVIVHLDGRYGPADAPGERYPLVCVTGLQSRSFAIRAPVEGSRVLGIRLHPTGGFALFGRSVQELRDSTTDLRDVVGSAANELADLCASSPSPEAVVRAAMCWLNERLQGATCIRPAIARIARTIESCAGRVSIGELREDHGFSRTRFATEFREQLGVTAKRFARIHRFRNVLAQLHRDARPLAELAITAGYADQPHMNAEFREMAGLTPLDYVNAMRYPGSASLAEY